MSETAEIAETRRAMEKLRHIALDDLSLPNIDAAGTVVHNEPMSTPSREEFNARLEAIDSRMDARVASIEGKISNLVIQLEASNSSNVAAIATVTEATKKNEENHRSLKYWLIGTAIAAVVGLYSANIAMVQTMFGAFESGKTTASAITQATEQMKQTQDQLRAIEERLAKQAPAPPPPGK